MIDYKSWNLKELGGLLILGLVLVIVIAIVMMFVSPLLVTVLPGIFTTPLTLTDTLLFLILLRTFVK